MKKLLFITLALAGCADTSDSNTGEHNSSLASLSSTWRVVSFENYDANTIIYPTEENTMGYDITISFDETSDPHKISGKNTTNDYFGTFEYLTGNKVHVTYFSTTKVAQPELGDEFSRALNDDQLEFSIQNSKLKLYYENKDRSITLVPD